jgi:hypothetical protein
VRVGAYLAQNIQAIAVGQHQIEHHQRGALGLDALPRRGAVIGRQDAIPCLLQI